MIKVLPAWKAVRSEATVTGDEVLGSQVIANICLEGSTPVNVFCFCLLWRSAFQAHRPLNAPPGTPYPVTVAALRSAFQAP